MKSISLLIILLLNFCGMSAQQNATMHKNDYTLQWEEVAALEKKSLPQSAAEEVNRILRLAVSEQNSPQLIKALIHLGKYDLARDVENDTLVFTRLRGMLEKSSDAVERAVLHSMLGELYLQYYQKDQWQIRQRTELRGYIPTDMKEWTRNIFYDRVVEHLEASLAEREQLETATVSTYAAVVDEGKDSRRFYPTMYDFLSRRAIKLYQQLDDDDDLSRTLARKQIAPESLFAPVETYVQVILNPQPGEYNLMLYETYRKLLTSLLGREMTQSVLLTDLDRLESLAQLQQTHRKQALPSLEALLKEWEGDPFSVEIINRMAELRQEEIYRIPEESDTLRNNKTKALYTFLQESVKRYADYERIGVLQNRLEQLTSPHFLLTGNNTFSIDGEKKIKVTFKNLHSLKARLYRVDSPADIQMHHSGVRQDIGKKRSFVREISVDLPDTAPYLEGETEIELNLREPGSYMLTFDSQPETNANDQSSYFFAVSKLALFSRAAGTNQHHFYVVERVSGQPVTDAEVIIYNLSGNWRNGRLTETERITTNRDGMAVYSYDESDNRNLFFHAVSDDDNGSLLTRLNTYRYFTAGSDDEQREQIAVFTDRSLYRPGQTVYYKAVLTRESDAKRSPVVDRQIELSLHDANGEKIASQMSLTNAFGSGAGEFILPQGLLPGIFTLRTESGSISFRVEEYKRPTFGVTFLPVEGSYRFGEEVTLKGEAVAYSGVPLQGAAVIYRITRQQSWWRFWGGTPEQVAEGVVTSDDQGSFDIRFIPEKSDTEQSRQSAFTFIVEATVTDMNGETQVGTYSLSVGDVSMMLQLEMSERWEKEGSDPIRITAKNLSDSDVKAEGRYLVYAVNENDSIRREVAKGLFETGSQPELKRQLTRLRSGKYRVKLFSEDDKGNPVEAEKDLILFSFSDKRPPVETNDWFIVRNSTFAPGKPAEIVLGTTDRVHLLYELWKEDQMLDKKWLILDNENKHFTFPWNEQYGEGVTLMLTHVKDEQYYSHHIDLLRKVEKQELKVRLDLFRDRIRPGSEEEWRVTVTDAEGNPLLVELLASMYDFSLDQIYPSPSWSLPSATLLRYQSTTRHSRDNSFNRVYGRGYIPVPWIQIPELRFDQFNWHGFSFYNDLLFFRSSSAKLEESVVVGYGTARSQMAVTESDMIEDVQEEVNSLGDDGVALPPPSPERESTPQVRRNFSETAFFYPQLRTNEKGETQIAFTVPESNTRWRFRLLAHDRTLRSGTAEAFTISQKELMVTPNMPRFLREGDYATLSTRISNLTDSLLVGEVKLELFEPLTDKLISEISVDDTVKPFSLAAGKSVDATWDFVVPSGIDLMGVRIVAESELFSDGEQHALAVLPSRMMVTESMRMDLNGNETKQFEMKQLLESSSPTAEEYRLTVEFASSPAWYAVQALPVLSDPASDNAVAWFAAYYTTSIGGHIGMSYPRVTAMVDAWQKMGGGGESLQSQLAKNEELKNLLMEETPWVLEARNESEQRQRLSLLFDLNRSRDQLNRSVRRLQELQTGDGGWSWFNGFRSSTSITHYILYGFSRLQELGALHPGDDILSMQSKALAYADAEALRRLDALKKNNRDWKKITMIPLTDLEYLYVRSAYADRPMDEEVKEMTAFYHSVVQKYWTSYGLYERSLVAVLMHRNHQKEAVQAILRSFREHATHSEELGTYWANNRAQVFMSQSAISVHTFIMDAFRLGGTSTEETDQMKRWLLKQKQTQQWETTHATTDAVYALLSGGSDWFTGTGETTITVGDSVVEPEKREAGTGYFKKSWSRSEIDPAMGVVTVKHSGSGPAWGALYRQYFEEMDKVTKSNGSLDIEKQLFLEQTDETGRELVPLTDDQPLKVGDKVVVRLTLRNDRDLEFVHIKDLRAASLEPATQLSGLAWQNGVPYYQVTKDASTSFYFDLLPRGTRVFEYTLYVNRAGSYSGGIATVLCLYAPAFTSHTAGMRIIVKE